MAEPEGSVMVNSAEQGPRPPSTMGMDLGSAALEWACRAARESAARARMVRTARRAGVIVDITDLRLRPSSNERRLIPQELRSDVETSGLGHLAALGWTAEAAVPTWLCPLGRPHMAVPTTAVTAALVSDLIGFIGSCYQGSLLRGRGAPIIFGTATRLCGNLERNALGYLRVTRCQFCKIGFGDQVVGHLVAEQGNPHVRGYRHSTNPAEPGTEHLPRCGEGPYLVARP